jgi:predicted GNAT superfamily acetyltransferase
MKPEIIIRRARTVADYQACQNAQRAAWGIADDSYVVPVATMVGAQLHGGLVLGAFLPEGEAVGLSFAFLGRTDGRLCLYSQLTGVVPGYQGQGLGFLLKDAQRDVARAEQIPCIAWAFDPLQAGNARFNLEKLGATSGRYVVNMYGPRSDALNRNTSTDRLIAVWETEPVPPRLFDAALVQDLPRIVAAELASDDPARPIVSGIPGDATRVLLEVPSEINALRAEHPNLAERWGLGVREGFVSAFEAGFRAVGFVRDGNRGFYVLERG